MSEVIDNNIKLDQFNESDWSYDAHFDVVFVREGSPIYTFLVLKLS